jgi:hypothetical protein
MHDSMQKITSVPGVIGAAVFDESGACLAHALKPPYEAILLTEILLQLRDVYDNYLALAESAEINSLVGSFEGGYLLIRRQQTQTLIVLASEAVNLAMLGVSINIAQLKLSRAGDQPPQPVMALGSQPPPPPPRAFERPPVSSSAPPPLPPPRGVSPGQSVRGPARSVADSQVSISWSSDDLGQQKPPPDAVGLAVMRHVLKALARRIGAVDARAILDEELRTIGATPATVRAGDFTDIIHSVASRMANTDDREAFIADALGDAGF